jgi:Potassium-transporting ATPase A subunit
LRNESTTIGNFWVDMTSATLYTGTMPTDDPLFIGFLLAVVAIVTLLQYLPALALGPIAEHFHISRGSMFLGSPMRLKPCRRLKYCGESWRIMDYRPSLPNPYADSDHPH